MAEGLDEAERLIDAGKLERAYAICRAWLEREPGSARAHELIGIICLVGRAPARTLEFADAAARLGAEDARLEALRAQAFELQGRMGAALAAAERGRALVTDAPTHSALGRIFRAVGRPEALEHLRAAAALAPANSLYRVQLASTLQLNGEFAEAERVFREAIALDPKQPLAWFGLTQLRPKALSAEEVAQLEALHAHAGDPGDALIYAHARAKLLEDAGAHADAMAMLAPAKRAKREALDYTFAQDAALFEAARATGGPASGETAQAPIFIIGLPRTGTTVIERTLVMHPAVRSAGETDEFWIAAKRLAATPSDRSIDPETVRAAAHVDMATLGRNYLERIALRVGEGEGARVIDKTLLNFLAAGLIHRALPNARIICVRRDAADAVAANYAQFFTGDFTYYGYATDLADTARFVRAFEALAEHWREVLPPERFTEIHYEKLIADQEGETRRLLAFCGLPWDPRCLSFQDAPGFVRTASAVQVRQPLNANSIGRWKRYGEAFAPALEILKD